MSLKDELAAWCRSYVTAFAANDAAEMVAHWTLPALTTQAGRSFVFKTEDHFTQNTSRLLDFYRAQAVARIERTVVDCNRLHRDAVSMIVSDIVFSDDGREITRWQAAYVLQRIDGAWKAVMAVADGEIDAWAALGTPLGG